MKGFSITGLILGIIATGSRSCCHRDERHRSWQNPDRVSFNNSAKRSLSRGPFFLSFFIHLPFCKCYGFLPKSGLIFWHLKQTGFLEKHHRMLYNK